MSNDYMRYEYFHRLGYDPGEIYRWLSVSSKLTPFENLLLVGFLGKHPDMPLEEINRENIISAASAENTEDWFHKYFRDALRAYCDFQNSIGGAFAGEGFKVAVRELSPFIALYLGITLGPAVGFSFWALKFGLEKWCGKYANQYYDGKGQYMGNFNGNPVHGLFEVIHRPAIAEAIKNKKEYPFPIRQVKIYSPARTTARFIPDPTFDLKIVESHFNKNGGQSFIFTDGASNKQVQGTIRKLTCHPIVRIHAGDKTYIGALDVEVKDLQIIQASR